MSKAKLTKLTQNQQRRIKNKQAKIIESELLPDVYPGLIISHYGDSVDVENNLNHVIKCHLRQNLPALAVGDRVLYQLTKQALSAPSDGVVTKLLERTSVLFKNNLERKTIKPIAANIDQIFIVFACEPEPHSLLIDQFLINAELSGANGIPATLIFNKYDLFEQLDPANHQDQQKIKNLKNLLNIYQKIGYEILTVSVFNSASLRNLEHKLANKNSIFVGASGVGKSTISQQLLPDLFIKTGALSEKSLQGRHTTSVARLYHLANNGNLIDAPGMREIDVSHLSKEQLESAFPEFRAYNKKCKFNDCNHDKEPECALKAAVASGAINMIRWENYKQLRSS